MIERTVLLAIVLASCGPAPNPSGDADSSSVRYSRSCDRVTCETADRVRGGDEPREKRCIWHCAHGESGERQRVELTCVKFDCWECEIDRSADRASCPTE